TSDKFRTLDFEPHPWQPAEGAVAFGEDIIVHIQATSTSHILRYSTNKGKTWETYDKPFGGDAIAAGGPLSAVALQVVADRTVWVLCQQESGGDARALLYRV